MTTARADIRQGIRLSTPIALGYFAVSFAFGISAVQSGVPPFLAAFISLTNLSSSGQFAGVQILAAGGTYVELVLSVLIINLRYILMGLSLSQKMIALPRWQKLILGYGVTDEIYAAAIQQEGDLSFLAFGSLIVLPVLGWTGGTLAGALMGQLLPPSITAALGIALYCMFIAIVVPPATKDRRILKTVLLSAGMSIGLTYLPQFSFLPVGWRVIICTLLASALMAVHDVRTLKERGM